MDYDIMKKIKKYDDSKDMCSVLKEKFGPTSVAKLRDLTTKFETYKKCPDHSM